VTAGRRRSLRSLLRVRSLQKEVVGVVRSRARPRGPQVPSTMAAFLRYQRGNEMQGEVQI
jgi:hypothetical protein